MVSRGRAVRVAVVIFSQGSAPATALGQQRQIHCGGHRAVRAQQRVSQFEQFVTAGVKARVGAVPKS